MMNVMMLSNHIQLIGSFVKTIDSRACHALTHTTKSPSVAHTYLDSASGPAEQQRKNGETQGAREEGRLQGAEGV
jgi:hypothetical protein